MAVEEIVGNRVTAAEREPEELTVFDLLCFTDAEAEGDLDSRIEEVPKKLGFTVGDPDAEIDVDRVDVLEAVFVGDPDVVLDVIAVAETDRVELTDVV